MYTLIKLLFKAGLIKVVGIGLTFLFLLMVARNATDIEYGVFGALFSAATILGFAFTAGQHVLVLRYWPSLDETASRAAADAALRWSWRRLLAIAGGGSVLLYALAWFWRRADATPPLLVEHAEPLLAMTLAFAFSEFAQAALRARGEVLISLSGREVLWRVLSIAAVLIIGSLSGAGFVWLCAITLAGINLVQLFLVFRRMSPPAPLTGGLRTAMTRRTGWFWLGATVGPLTTHSGTIIVAMVLGPFEAGAYFAADRLAKLLSIALIAVNQVLGPELSRSFHAGHHAKVQRLMTLSALAAGAIALVGAGVFALAGTSALSMFSPSYADVWPVLMILTAGQVVNGFCGPNTMLMNMAGLERANTLIMAGTGCLVLAALWLGAQTFGIAGAALAACLTMIVWNGLITYQCSARLGIMPMRLGSIAK